ncbi:uncharacterized protein BdWA1_003725 [Babesia duncani]|uniref:Uncharacterized protein n=1 Tax=Babesia duncani TaxID=323732 RepID=A0AAD9UMA6_9APIC|nr:hypothetical protein BdWA1_003725 [Babesia duncani]
MDPPSKRRHLSLSARQHARLERQVEKLHVNARSKLKSKIYEMRKCALAPDSHSGVLVVKSSLTRFSNALLECSSKAAEAVNAAGTSSNL